MYKFLLELLYQFNIAIPSKEKILIPCLLDKYMDTMEHSKNILATLSFPEILPISLFPSIVADSTLYPYVEIDKHIWKDAIYFQDQ